MGVGCRQVIAAEKNFIATFEAMDWFEPRTPRLAADDPYDWFIQAHTTTDDRYDLTPGSAALLANRARRRQ